MSNAEQVRGETISAIITEFAQAFAFARSHWTRSAEQAHPELSGVALLILQIVVRRGSITATDISHLLRIDKASVSRQVTLLKSLEFLATDPSPEDRRVILLSATANALELISSLKAQHSGEYYERFSEWNNEDLARLRDLLSRFNAGAGATDPAPNAPRCCRNLTQ